MLLTRAEMSHDFSGARFDLDADRDALAWILSQLLYVEVESLQAGRWIPEAPDLDSARALARGCVEDHDHVRSLMRVFTRLGAEPVAAHPVIRLLAARTGAWSWEEHVALEMAHGHGLRLCVIYALCATVAEPEVAATLEAMAERVAARVDFGERQALSALAEDPGLHRRLLGLHLLHLHALRLMAEAVRPLAPRHRVLRHLPWFLTRAATSTELRLTRMGLLDRPLASVGRRETLRLVGEALAARWTRRAIGKRPSRLTTRYLDDPLVSGGEVAFTSRLR